MWIEKDGRKILFDTGQSSVFCHNAKFIGVDLTDTDFIVLSHGHYDHCGGLEYLPVKEKKPKVYVHPDIFRKKFVVNEHGMARQIGVPWDREDLSWLHDNITYNRKPLSVESGIWLSGEIPASNAGELSGGFFLEKDGKMVPDLFLDEQMLLIEENNGIVVFLGCSHPGVFNCLQYVQQLFPGKDILLLVAGMHLAGAGPAHLQLVSQNIRDLGVQKVVPLHCTGFAAVCEMKRRLGDRCLLCSTGDTIEL